MMPTIRDAPPTRADSLVVKVGASTRPSFLRFSSAPSRRSTMVMILFTVAPCARTALTACITEPPLVVTVLDQHHGGVGLKAHCAAHESGIGPSATSLGGPGMSAFGGDCVAKVF